MKGLRCQQGFAAIHEAYDLLSGIERIAEAENSVKEYDIQLSILRHKFERIRTAKMIVSISLL